MHPFGCKYNQGQLQNKK